MFCQTCFVIGVGSKRPLLHDFTPGGRAARARGLATLATIATFSTLFACGGGGGSVNPANPTPTPRPSTTPPLEPTPAPPTASPGTPTPTVSVTANPGDLDPTFGGTGIVTIDLSPGSDALGDLAVQPDGRVVAVGGTSGADTSRFAVVRLEADGTMDASFGSNGVVETAIAPRLGSCDGRRCFDAAVAVALQTDGKIVVAGNASNEGGEPTSGIGVARYDVNGTLDASFADGGISITAIGIPRWRAIWPSTRTVASSSLAHRGSGTSPPSRPSRCSPMVHSTPRSGSAV